MTHSKAPLILTVKQWPGAVFPELGVTSDDLSAVFFPNVYLTKSDQSGFADSVSNYFGGTPMCED